MNKLAGEPLISVIIPSYNRADIISRAIDSVIKQSYKNLEIVIVDDASKDNTEEVIRAIGEPRIRYIRHQTNGGADKARNTGVAAATGEYVAFLDSDDVWLPNKIELQLAAIQNHPEAEKAVCYTQVKDDRGDKVFIQPSRGKNEAESLADYLFVNRGFIQTSTVMIPRYMAVATPFRSGISPHEDLDVFLRLEASGAKFIFIEKPLSVWHNEPRTNRLTKMPDYRISLNWIMQYESLISSQAMKGFIIIEVVPRLIKSNQKKFYTAKLIIDAALHGVISPKRFAQLIAWLFIPTEIRQKLKTTLKIS